MKEVMIALWLLELVGFAGYWLVMYVRIFIKKMNEKTRASRKAGEHNKRGLLIWLGVLLVTMFGAFQEELAAAVVWYGALALISVAVQGGYWWMKEF